MGAELWADFARFHQLSRETHDVDPVYPVLRGIVDFHGLLPQSEEAVWLSIAHLTWYHLGSALSAWDRAPDGTGWEKRKLPCSTERRGNRVSSNLLDNVQGWRLAADFAGGIVRYLTHGAPEDPRKAWEWTMRVIEEVPQNGRWASYKLAEMLVKVNGFNLEPFHMGHANSSGPRRGLELLIPDLPKGNSPKDVRMLDDLSDAFCYGLTANGIEAPIEETETTLCDFHALFEGRYYVGHDIDAMLEQLMAVPSDETDVALQARYDTLPHEYLGELGGWNHVDPERNKAYKLRREIVTR